MVMCNLINTYIHTYIHDGGAPVEGNLRQEPGVV